MHPFICLLYGWTIKIEAVAHKIYSYASVYYFIIYVVQYIGRRKSFFFLSRTIHIGLQSRQLHKQLSKLVGFREMIANAGGDLHPLWP